MLTASGAIGSYKLDGQAHFRYENERYEDRFEWVYNGADIDAQEVVWARALGPKRNRELLEYFSDRHAWRFRPESAEGFTVRLEPVRRR